MSASDRKKTNRLYLSLFQCRRIVQLLFLSIYVFLFTRTDYSGADKLEYVVNILFRLDPYLAAVTMLASRTFIALMVPAIGVLVLSLFLGRSFCGWFCPMGTLLDGMRKIYPTDVHGKIVSVKQPYVVDDLCIGCSICEFKCPLPGRSAILVNNANESRDPRKAIPKPSHIPYG